MLRNLFFPSLCPTDAPTLKGANRHEHGRQLNIVPGGSQLRGPRFDIDPVRGRVTGRSLGRSIPGARGSGAWVDSLSRGSGALVGRSRRSWSPGLGSQPFSRGSGAW